MSNPKITKLTKEDIAAAKGSSVAKTYATAISNPVHNRASLYSTEYITKLPLNEIKKFFEKFDVTSCEKIPNEKEPKYVVVNCNGFRVTFTDYSFAFDFNDTLLIPDESKTKFNLQAFADYCSTIEKTPDQLISELMAVELFGQRFSSYAPRRREVKQKENKLAFNALPREMQKTLKTFHEKQEQSIDATYNKNYFGSYDISSTLSTSDKQ